MTKFKCLACKSTFSDVEALYAHYDEVHGDAIPKDYTPAQYHYYLKTGKSHGSCVVCKRETVWNDATNKYHRFCGRKQCKDQYVNEFRKRMIGAHGQVHLLNDPDQQRKMLANRSISGEYVWSDGKKVGYTGSYEKDFLQFLDVFMDYSSDDIMSPSPHTYTYTHEGVDRFYIPDFFIPSLNLEIEVKDGGDNPNNHHKIQAVDKQKERLKDKVMTSQKQFSYIKIINKEYEAFFDLLMQKKKQFAESGSVEKPIFILENAQEEHDGEIVTESMGDITLKEIENKKRSGFYSLITLKPKSFNDTVIPQGELLYPSIASNLKQLQGSVSPGDLLSVYEPASYDDVDLEDSYFNGGLATRETTRVSYAETIKITSVGDHVQWVSMSPTSVTESSNVRTDTNKYPVYVLLTHSGTVLANAIKKVTKNPYSHASISFSPELNSMYSFGRKYKDNPFIGTFVKEDINAGLYGDVKDTATYSLYVTWVTADERDAMMRKLSEFTDSTKAFKYNFTGLIKHQMGRESHREDAYFCSEFVDTVLKAGSPYFDKHSSLVKPYDFATNKHFSFVTKGLLKGYDVNKVNRLTKLMDGGKN